jgi:3',5'-cyclic AMP phosphodiesterase CpdA
MGPKRIALCSDTHFWPGATRRYGYHADQLQPWSEVIQTCLLAELAAISPDLILHLGDLTCGGGHFQMPHDQFFTTLTATVTAFRALPAEFYALPGNHDCPENGDWTFASQYLGLDVGLGRTIDLPLARLVLLNAQGHSPAKLTGIWPNSPNAGWVSPAELARLDEALATAGQRPVFIFSHQLLWPWLEPTQPWQELYGIENVAEVLAVLGRHGNVRAVFQGHAHRVDVQQARLGPAMCWFVVLPAIIVYPMAWLQLDLWPDQLQVRLHHLPLPELAELSRDTGQAWRAGQAEWHNYTIPI